MWLTYNQNNRGCLAILPDILLLVNIIKKKKDSQNKRDTLRLKDQEIEYLKEANERKYL